MRDLVESYRGHWNKLLSESLKAAKLGLLWCSLGGFVGSSTGAWLVKVC